MGNSYLFDVLENLETILDDINVSFNPSKYYIDALISLIEEIFVKIKDFFSENTHKTLVDNA